MAFFNPGRCARTVATVIEAGPSRLPALPVKQHRSVSSLSKQIPPRERSDGEGMKPDEWAAQMKGVREWRARMEERKAATETESTTPSPKSHLLSSLLASTAHLAHPPSQTHPAFLPYLHSTRSNLSLIDLERATIPLLRRAADFVKGVVKRDGVVLIVGTRKGHRAIVNKGVERLGGNGFGVAGEWWMPGTLTNSVSYFGPNPARSRTHIPDLVILLNPRENQTCIKECNIMNVPTVGLVDSDTDPRVVGWAVPGNVESMRTAELFVSTLTLAGKAGREERLNEAAKGLSGRKRR